MLRICDNNCLNHSAGPFKHMVLLLFSSRQVSHIITNLSQKVHKLVRIIPTYQAWARDNYLMNSKSPSVIRLDFYRRFLFLGFNSHTKWAFILCTKSIIRVIHCAIEIIQLRVWHCLTYEKWKFHKRHNLSARAPPFSARFKTLSQRPKCKSGEMSAWRWQFRSVSICVKISSLTS